MTMNDRDNPERSSRPAQTVHRLQEARHDRIRETREREQATRPTGPLGEDPMMSLPDRPRRKRCKHCRYRFDYRMHTNLCPECGRYRDDYPHPNHGLAALLFASAVVGALCLLVAVVVIVRSI